MLVKLKFILNYVMGGGEVKEKIIWNLNWVGIRKEYVEVCNGRWMVDLYIWWEIGDCSK